jgi:archaemetzincin
LIAQGESNELRTIRAAGQAIGPLHEPIRATQQGDWLDEHDEPGQTFEEYLRSDPRRPAESRTTMYLQPLGDFDAAPGAALEATAGLLEDFYAR